MRCPGNTKPSAYAAAVLAAFLLLIAAPSPAEEEMPSAKAWAASYWQKQIQKQPAVKAVPIWRSIAVLGAAKAKAQPSFPAFDDAAFNKLSYLQAVPWLDAQLTFGLGDALPTSTGQSEEQRLSKIAALLNADALLLTALTPKQWGLAVVEAGQARILLRAPKAAGTKAQDLVQWLRKHLGYDAVIIDMQDDYILAAGLRANVTTGRQGVIIEGSSRQPVLKGVVDPKTASATAIVEVVDSDGAYTVLQKVVSRKTPARGSHDAASATATNAELGAKIQFGKGL